MAENLEFVLQLCQCCGSGMFIPWPDQIFFSSRIRIVSIPYHYPHPKI